MWHKDILTGPKPQIHLKNSLSQNTKAKAQEISQGAHTLSKYQSPNQSRQNESKPNTTQI